MNEEIKKCVCVCGGGGGGGGVSKINISHSFADKFFVSLKQKLNTLF